MTLEEIKTIDLFSGLDDGQLTCNVDGQLVEYAPGDTIFTEGQCADRFYVILEGVVELTRMMDGQRVHINEFSSGSTAGEVPLLMGAPHMADATAKTHVKQFQMTAPAFWKMMAGCDTLRGRILADMAERYAQLQSVTVRRAKLASLGTMSAGLAHELNNPASAARRAAQQLCESLEQFNRRAAEICQPFIFKDPIPTGYAFEEIQARVNTADESLRESSRREDALIDWLDELGLDEADAIAEQFAAAGLTAEQLQELAARLKDDQVENFLRWSSTDIEIRLLADELKNATSRISELISALKRYSYLDQASDKSATDINRGVIDTLIILKHKAKRKNLSYEKSLGELPEIQANGSELNQVWTNLLDNAIDASPEGGVLGIRTFLEVGPSRRCVVVEIEDAGTGIPDEIKDRIFDTFFTTKGVGSGTGLGLDISNRIVTRTHNGSIDVESRPGRTVFRVSLPVEG